MLSILCYNLFFNNKDVNIQNNLKRSKKNAAILPGFFSMIEKCDETVMQ